MGGRFISAYTWGLKRKTILFKMDFSNTPYLDITSNDFLYLMDKATLTAFEVETLRYFINNLNSFFCFLGDYDDLIPDIDSV